MVSQLTEENGKLKARLKKEAQDCQDFGGKANSKQASKQTIKTSRQPKTLGFLPSASEHEANLMEKMKGTIEQQRSQLRTAEQDNLQKSQEIEAVRRGTEEFARARTHSNTLKIHAYTLYRHIYA